LASLASPWLSAVERFIMGDVLVSMHLTEPRF